MLDFKIDLMSKNTDELIYKYNIRPVIDTVDKIHFLTYLDDFIMLDNEICDKLIVLSNAMKNYFNAFSIVEQCDLMINELEEKKETLLCDNLNRIDVQLESLLNEINMYVSRDYNHFSKKQLDDILKSLVFIERVHINTENTRNDLDPVFRYINRKSFERKYDKAIKNFDKRLENEKILMKSK